MGHDMRELIQRAMDQWLSQTEEEDRTGPQRTYGGHYEEFKR
eukprot:CAMPEP_0185583056 /NCGR_PEP_ID=MMETSP0434-20130131/21294_1 /TAXON_ID=626734 ORGANISM="Favella taraikaensis, Strain Fe Narragansett Bay" /NCGR_SAMPLE_ID=MMETSP0434 /ASSEMBLY_ACC=CAM_ASM_000379 /LENGTH=41 /DNA_ID= /DNA_START= /DNA_END= /DNA_ORIENTATION=